jgi:RNA polymerase sigma factor (sigma-70 family)
MRSPATPERFVSNPSGFTLEHCGTWSATFPVPLKELSLAAHHSIRHGSGDTAAVSAADTQHYEALLLANLPVVEKAIQFVCHRHKVPAADVEEFASEVKLKLVDRNYQVLRKFEGRCSLPTFLTVVIQRIYLDFRNHQWGKWRPSAEAKRLGRVAVRLETLMGRDGLVFTEACRLLEISERSDAIESELIEIASRLPLRVRRTMVGEEALENTTSGVHDDPALLNERRAAALRIGGVLNAAVRKFTEQDRSILRLRFQEGFSIVEISRALHLECKPLYRRVERMLKALRIALRESGVDNAETRDVLRGTGLDISLALLGDDRPQ